MNGNTEIKEGDNNMGIMLNDFIEDMKSDTTTCKICGQLITKKRGMVPCGIYHSFGVGHYVCLHCYVIDVKPFLEKLADMKITADKEYRC